MEDPRLMELEEDIAEQFEEQEDNIGEGDEEDEDESPEDYEGEEAEELITSETTSPRFSSSIANGLVDDSNACDGKPVCQGNGGDDGGQKELNRGEIDVCPICFEAWTSGGDHQICCLPCGHIYGMSCIKRCLLRCRSDGKCPQCKSLYTLQDIRVLYATRLCIDDEKSHKATTPNFPYTREGFSGFQRHVSSCMDELQLRMDALERRTQECASNLQFLQQRYNELMGQALENSQ